MGYTTEFKGQFNLDKPLTKEHKDYLLAFSGSRRMRRQPYLAETFEDHRRLAVGLPIGEQGDYYVGGFDDGDFGQTNDESVDNFNSPPDEQPGLWCNWIPNEDGTTIEWDGGEKFYNYIEWLEYLIKHFLKPWGYTLNGEVRWRGEDFDDIGTIQVNSNEIKTVNRYD